MVVWGEYEVRRGNRIELLGEYVDRYGESGEGKGMWGVIGWGYLLEGKYEDGVGMLN